MDPRILQINDLLNQIRNDTNLSIIEKINLLEDVIDDAELIQEEIAPPEPESEEDDDNDDDEEWHGSDLDDSWLLPEDDDEELEFDTGSGYVDPL